MSTNNSINNLNFNNVTAINTTTILSASAYGTEVICTGASAYTVTLPTVTNNANKFIDIYSQTTSNALLTIAPASGTIAGQTNLIIGSGDGVRVMNDGTNWWVLNTWLQPASFFATLSTTQSISNNTTTTIAYNGVNFDVGSFFNTSTHAYVPLYPGKYQISQSVDFASSASGTGTRNAIEKNASIFTQTYTTFASASPWSYVNSAIVPMNGSTDSITGVTFQNSGSSLNLNATATNVATFLTGIRVSLF